MADRIFLDKQTPTVFKALTATASEIRTRAREIDLEHALLELVNIRASQQRVHLLPGPAHPSRPRSRRYRPTVGSAARLARDRSVHPTRAGCLGAGRSGDLVAQQHPNDAAYERARTVLADDEVSLVIWAAITINAFNRVSILSQHPIRRRHGTAGEPEA